MAETQDARKTKEEQQVQIADTEDRMANMRRVLLPLYEKWLAEGMPTNT